MCFGSGAERKRAPWWRTTRAFITTRRAFDRSRIETAARRPRPNRDRLRPWLERKLLPTWPGLLRGPHHLADEGLWALAATVAVLDASRPDAQVVVARRHGAAPRRQFRGDGARSLEILGLFAESASRGCWWRWRIPQSSQPHTPRRRPAFSLAVRGLVASAPPHPHPNLSDGPPDTDETEGSS